MHRFSRTEQLLGSEKMERLRRAHVALFGLGAVGSYAFEALVRAGIGRVTCFDHDTVSLSNCNRQLLALDSTMGRYKADVARERAKDINPECEVDARVLFADSDNVATLLSPDFDVVVDAIDGVNSKVNLLVAAREAGLPAVSSMGAAAKLDPSQVRVCDISKTFMCPLAQIIRKRLRRRGIFTGIRCVFSVEPPAPGAASEAPEENPNGAGRPRAALGSISYLTGIFGLFAASETIRILLDAPQTRPQKTV